MGNGVGLNQLPRLSIVEELHLDPPAPSAVVLEDHTLVRDLIVRTLTDELKIRVLGCGESAAEGVSLIKASKPDIVVLDWMLADGSAQKLICSSVEAGAACLFLVVSSVEDPREIKLALQAGARGCVAKRSGAMVFTDAVKTVLAGRVFLCPLSAEKLGDSIWRESRRQLPKLSIGETAVLELFCAGVNVKEIAAKRGSAAKTVHNQLTRIRQKLGQTDTPSLVRFAIRHGLVR